MTKTALVIGAGLGGLSAAIRLAGSGWQVTVLEQLDRPGGKLGETRADGYRWDTGASVITMRHVFEQLWREAGSRLQDDVTLLPLDPITRYFWPDGAQIDAVSDADQMADNIRTAGFDARDSIGYRRYMRHVAMLYETIKDPFLQRAQPTMRDLLKLPLADVFKIDAMRSMHAAVRAHFHDPHLIQLFDRFATYNGSSPHRAPATLNVIAHVEMAQGAWYPRGGVYALARGFAQLAARLGVTLCYNTRVSRIDVQGGRACGVQLADGRSQRADAVVVNADYTHAVEALLPTQPKPRRTMEPSCSGHVLLIKQPVPSAALAHHNIFFCPPDAYAAEFDAIFKTRTPAANPTVYVCITRKTDPDHAPPGHENWFVLVNAPYLSSAWDWRSREPEATRITLDALAQRHGLHIDAAQVHASWTPQTIQDTYNGHRGALYGFSSNNPLAAFLRPANHARSVRGLYFASGSAHPGGGVPLVTLSGMAAAARAMQDAA